MFCNSPKTRRRKINKGFLKKPGRCWPHALPIIEKFWKICQNVTQSLNGPPSPPRKLWKIWWKLHKVIYCHHTKYFEHTEYFEKFDEREIMRSVPYHASTTTTLTPSPASSLTWLQVCASMPLQYFVQYFACKIYENFLVLTMWIILILPLYSYGQIVAKIYFSNHSHCLLLLITQCDFLIYSLYCI